MSKKSREYYNEALKQTDKKAEVYPITKKVEEPKAKIMVEKKDKNFEPYLKKQVKVTEEDLKEVATIMMHEACDEFANKFETFAQSLREITAKQIIIVDGKIDKNLRFDRKISGLFANNFTNIYERYSCDYGPSIKKLDYKINGLAAVVLKANELTISIKENRDLKKLYGLYVRNDGYLCVPKLDMTYNFIVHDNNGEYKLSYILSLDTYNFSNYSNYLVITAAFPDPNLRGSELSDLQSINFLLKHNLLPMEISDADKKLFEVYSTLYEKLNKYMKIVDNRLKLDRFLFLEEVFKGLFKEKIVDISFDYNQLLDNLRKGTTKLKSLDAYKKRLLSCDYERAHLSPYADNQISDLNMGHWDLVEDVPNGISVDVPAGEFVVARPPQKDINRNGVCGIDFGTKSTVVAYYKNEARLLRVGKGDYTKVPELKDYENPTAIELKDFAGFIKAYNSRMGRPYTMWEQVTVSHQAVEAIFTEMEDSKTIYSVFSELKQWAIDKNRRLMLSDAQGQTFEVKPYCELKEGDFDPIEIYAYYLGLYINNIRNGIYMHYVLSFPVNYEKAVREQLMESFKRGLKKSMPPAILKDEEAMKMFKLYDGASEPAAYAISALQEFNLQPKQIGEKVCYGVFDFGGGTTDFDFGIEEIPEDGRSKYKITQFGNGGDKYLGGENILLILAYEVYLDNLEIMRKEKISFVLPPKCQLVAGTETLIAKKGNASQNAYLNLRRLAEELRPLWERHKDYKEKFTSQSHSSILFNDKGEPRNLNLKVNVSKLEKRIEDVIESGVVSFFVAFANAFKDRDEVVCPINIFLAGNSSKSPVVKALFEKHVKLTEARISNMTFMKNGSKKDAKGIFKLYMPLGMPVETQSDMDKKHMGNSPKSSSDILKEIKNKYSQTTDTDFDKVLTGKTGVVFGLLRSRIGGRDVRLMDQNKNATKEVAFRYFLGVGNREDKFHVVVGKGIDYNQWVKFTFADEEYFEIYYTSEPKALDNTMPISSVNMISCTIDYDEVSYDADIYIRKVGPEKLEYVVGTEEEFEKGKFNNKIYTVSLSE